MIVEITTDPDEHFSYEDVQAVKEAIRGLGHKIHFIDVWNTWDVKNYIEKLERKSPSVSRDYIRRKRETDAH